MNTEPGNWTNAECTISITPTRQCCSLVWETFLQPPLCLASTARLTILPIINRPWWRNGICFVMQLSTPTPESWRELTSLQVALLELNFIIPYFIRVRDYPFKPNCTRRYMGSYEHNEIEIYGTGDANFWKGLGRSLTDCKKGGRRRRIFMIWIQGMTKELVLEIMLINVSSFFVVAVGR